MRVAPTLGSRIRGRRGGIAGCFSGRIGIRTLLSMRGSQGVTRVALGISNIILHNIRTGSSVCTTVSLICSGLMHRVRGCGAGVTHHVGGNTFGSTLIRNPTIPRRGFRITHIGGFTTHPVSMRRTVLRVGLMNRSFFMFLGSGASAVGIICGQGRKGCNLVRPRCWRPFVMNHSSLGRWGELSLLQRPLL